MLRIDVDSLPSTLLTIGKALEVVVRGCVIEPDFWEADRIEFEQLVCYASVAQFSQLGPVWLVLVRVTNFESATIMFKRALAPSGM